MMSSQLNLPHGTIQKKNNEETKNKNSSDEIANVVWCLAAKSRVLIAGYTTKAENDSSPI